MLHRLLDLEIMLLGLLTLVALLEYKDLQDQLEVLAQLVL
jgi:hypothetical protein